MINTKYTYIRKCRLYLKYQLNIVNNSADILSYTIVNTKQMVLNNVPTLCFVANDLATVKLICSKLL